MSRLPGFLLLAIGMIEASFGQGAGWVQQKEAVPAKIDKPVPAAPGQEIEDMPLVRGKNAKTSGRANPKAKQKAKARPAPAIQNFVQPAANIMNIEQQITPQIRSLFRSEMHFMRRICDPKKAEFEQIAEACEPQVKTLIKELANEMTGGRIVREGSKTASMEPRQCLAQEIVRAAQKVLLPAKVARYEHEVAKRTEAHKRAIREILIVRLNDVLLLSPDQRSKIAEIMEGKWEVPLNQGRYLLNANQYFPQIPDKEIVELLTENQKAEWSRIPKVNFSYRFNPGMIGDVDAGEETWDDDGSGHPAAKPAPVKPNLTPMGAKS